MEEKNIVNFCEVSRKKFVNKETQETISYNNIIWHIGDVEIELKPANDKSKGALQILINLGLIKVKGGE